jgi:hypothetical protein
MTIRNLRAAGASAALLAAVFSAGCGSGSLSDGQSGPDDPLDRSIDLSGATGPIPLGTADQAARAALGSGLFYSSVTDTLASSKASAAKATENCAGGGTRTTTESGLDRTIRYTDCLEGSLFTDGLIILDVTSPGIPTSETTVTLGENTTALLAENRNPADDSRTLLLGTIFGDVTINLEGDVEEVDATLNLKGAAEDLSGEPRINFGLDSFHVHVNVDGDFLLIDELGSFRLSGDCTSGIGNADTTRDIRVNQNTGAVSDGELFLSNTAGVNATITYNADGTIDVAATSGTQHYTRQQFEALCPI